MVRPEEEAGRRGRTRYLNPPESEWGAVVTDAPVRPQALAVTLQARSAEPLLGSMIGGRRRKAAGILRLEEMQAMQ